MSKKQWFCMGALALAIVILICFIFQKSEDAINNEVQDKTEALPTIVIDPGHGGVDGGAIGCDGTVEKDINLSISLKLADYLRLSGFHVVMTRSQDVSINDEGATRIKDIKTSDLHNRMKIMQETPNNIFISIHQNKYSEEKYHGAQVFYSPNDEQSPLLAGEIQKSIASNIQKDNKREIKPSTNSIYLLYKAKSTAVMVECGFLSNQQEVINLKDASYQNQLAFTVMCGLINYLQIN